MKLKYIGITIGPIFDTICEASKPSSLWFASSMFSDITERLCRKITEAEEFGTVKIYSPYYEVADGAENVNRDGIGRYHDRIIFSVSAFDKDKLDSVIREVKLGTAEVFPEGVVKDASFFEDYIQIHYVALDEDKLKKNSVLGLSPLLDAMELMRTFPNGNVPNPVVSLFIDDKEDTVNSKIKNSSLFPKNNKDSQLVNKRGGFKQIEDIASCEKALKDCPWKYSHYFAIVSADGDDMGTFLKGLDDEGVSKFSKACLDYDLKASKMVKEYGGMTIYAGGDDLLFLAPVKNTEGKYIFNLCAEINQLFADMVRDSGFSENIPTVSFGIAIQYYKFPLYEAFDVSRDMLAKAKGISGKNAQAVSLQKHSGQTVELIVKNEKIGESDEFGLMRFLGNDSDENKIHSIIYTLRNYDGFFATLTEKAESGDMFVNGWMNMFDNAGQEKSEGFVRKISRAAYDEIVKGDGIFITSSENVLRGNAKLTAVIAVLQMSKFFEEKATEQEKGGR